MASPLTARMAQAMLDGNARVLLVRIDHPSGTGYFCDNVVPVEWDGHVWAAAGILGNVSPIKQSSEIAAQDIVFTLSGVDDDVIAQLDEDVHNRSGKAWLACLDEANNVIADPYLLVDSELDTQSFEVADDGTVTISITAHAGFYVLNSAVLEAWTPENQRLPFPGDTGLDKIPSLVNQDLPWTPT